MKAWEKVSVRLEQLQGGPHSACADDILEMLGAMLLRDGDTPVLIWKFRKVGRHYQYAEVHFPTLKEMKKRKFDEDPSLYEEGRYDDPECMLRFMDWIQMGFFAMVPWITGRDLYLLCYDFSNRVVIYRDDDDPKQIELMEMGVIDHMGNWL